MVSVMLCAGTMLIIVWLVDVTLAGLCSRERGGYPFGRPRAAVGGSFTSFVSLTDRLRRDILSRQSLGLASMPAHPGFLIPFSAANALPYNPLFHSLAVVLSDCIAWLFFTLLIILSLPWHNKKTWNSLHTCLKLTAPLKFKKEQFPVRVDGAPAAQRWRKMARRTPQGRGVQGWRRQDVCSGPIRKGHLPEPKAPPTAARGPARQVTPGTVPSPRG